jgi:hypothetical protein
MGGEVRRDILGYRTVHSFVHSWRALNEPSRVVNLLRLSTADSLTRACQAQGTLHAHRQGARDVGQASDVPGTQTGLTGRLSGPGVARGAASAI